MSAFSFTEFYQRNRRIVIWFILFLLLWALRAFFSLVFLSFVLAIVAAPFALFGERRLRLPHWVSLSVVYALFLLVLVAFVRFVVPSVASEVNRTILNLPAIEFRLVEAKDRLIERYPSLRQPLTGFLRSALPDEVAAAVDERLAAERPSYSVTDTEIRLARETNAVPTGSLADYFNRQDQLYLNAIMNQQFQRVRHYAPTVVNMLYRATATTLLALLFSYLILSDVGRMKRGIARLRSSKVGDFYEEAAPAIGRFGYLVGRAIEAQASIALINTALTIVGLLLLHIPLVAMLSVIVFVSSFVPVLGVLISTTPIVLVALNDGGLALSGAAIAMVVVIHTIEAYVLNPLLYGRHLRLNPVLTLIILYVGYHAFGLWGLLLGVPIARYFIHNVLDVPYFDRGGAAEAIKPPRTEPA